MPFKRIAYIVLSCLFCFIVTSMDAQKLGLSLDIAYHQGIQTKNYNDAPFSSTLSYSLGSGVSRQISLNIFPDSSNWFFSSGFQYFNGKGVITAYRKNAGEESENVQMLSVNSLRWLNKLTYSFHIKRFDINISGGLLLPLANGMLEETRMSDSMKSSTSRAKLKNYTTIGFTGGIGVSTMLTKKIKLFCNGDMNLLNSKVKSRKMTSYFDTKGGTMESEFPGTGYREIIYHTDPNLVRNN